MNYSLSRSLQRITNSIPILSLRQAFVALLPFWVLWAGLTLALGLAGNFSDLGKNSSIYQTLETISYVSNALLQLLVSISIGYHLSKNLGSNSLVCCTLVLTCFVINSNYIELGEKGISVKHWGADAYAIISPILSVYIFSYLSSIKFFNTFDTRHISVFLAKKINMILPYLVTLLVTTLLVSFISAISRQGLTGLSDLFGPQSTNTSFLIWNVLSHTLWLFGIHGTNVGNTIFGKDFLSVEMLPNLGIQEFEYLFMSFGGSGCLLGFVIASFLAQKNSHLNQIVKISVPFSLFNLSEILMYCVPIIFNPYFLIPFVISPIINSLVAYHIIAAGLVPITDTTVPWMMPPILSGFLIGGGSIATASLQILLISISTLIYFPFIRRYNIDNKASVSFDTFSSRFHVEHEFENKSEQEHLSSQDEKLKTTSQLRKTVDDILAGEPLLYYQPKVTTQGFCHGFEALIRIKTLQNKIAGPYFLDALENAGFSDVIDWWVIDKLADDMATWKAYGFQPHVSFNLNPSALANDDLVEHAIKSFSKYKNKVEVEILETTYIKKFKLIRKNIEKLKEQHIYTAIDDFGTGFSSLSLLYKLNAHTIKLDKSILDSTETEKGRDLYLNICSICKNLGFQLIAEGVETEEQALFAIDAGVDYLQGWLYAPAMPMFEAKEFALDTVDRLLFKSG